MRLGFMYKILFIEKNQHWKNFEELEKDNLFIDKVFWNEVLSPIDNYDLCIIEINSNDKEYLKSIKNIIVMIIAILQNILLFS